MPNFTPAHDYDVLGPHNAFMTSRACSGLWRSLCNFFWSLRCSHHEIDQSLKFVFQSESFSGEKHNFTTNHHLSNKRIATLVECFRTFSIFGNASQCGTKMIRRYYGLHRELVGLPTQNFHAYRQPFFYIIANLELHRSLLILVWFSLAA